LRKSLLALAVSSSLVGVQAHAMARSFTGDLQIRFTGAQTISMSGSGVADVNGSSGGGAITALALPAGAFAADHLTVPVTDPTAFPIRGLQLTAANEAGSFARSAGSFGGPMPLVGGLKLCLFLATTPSPCSGAPANLTIPLTVVGHSAARTLMTGPGVNAVQLTVFGAPWTTGTAAIGTLTEMGGISSLPNTSVVNLVTPIFVSTNQASGQLTWKLFGNLSIGLAVPEPGTLALLGGGIAVLLAHGRSRARRSRRHPTFD